LLSMICDWIFFSFSNTSMYLYNSKRFFPVNASRSSMVNGRRTMVFKILFEILFLKYFCMDGTIPRAKLPLVLHRMKDMARKYSLRVANVFHAGDGNLHPLILYDANKEGELERAEAFGADILRLCVEVGGVLTGEHGVGVEKRDLMGSMFSETDLNQQQRVKCAFDPKGLLNPGKVFPTLHRCAELGRMHISGGKLPFPDIPRF